MDTLKKSLFAEKLTNIYLCLILFFLPLVFNKGFYNISQSKSLCFLVLSILFIFCYLIYKIIYLIVYKKISLKPVILDWAVVIFAVANIISSVFSKYGNDVWIGKNSRLQGGLIILIYAIIYFIISNNLSQKSVFQPLLVLSFCIVSLVAILNSFDIDILGIISGLTEDDKERFISTIGNINFFSSYVCLCFPFIITIYCNTEEIVKKYHYLIAVILGSLAMVLTSSESFVIGFIAFLIIYLFFCFKNSVKLIRYLETLIILFITSAIFSYILKLANICNYIISDLLRILLNPFVAGCIIILCFIMRAIIKKHNECITVIRNVYIILLAVSFITIAFLFVYANFKSLGFLDKYFKITDSWGTSRGYIYKKCFEILKDFSVKEWLIGIGPETLQNVFDYSGGDFIDQAHSEYLQFLLTTGTVGLLSYLFIICSVTILIVKELMDDNISIALFMGLIAYWFQAMFNIAQSFTTPFVYLFIAIISGIYKNKISERRK